jgi:hypothetical protein
LSLLEVVWGRNEKSEIFVWGAWGHRKQNFIPWYYLLMNWRYFHRKNETTCRWLVREKVTEIVAALARAFISS